MLFRSNKLIKPDTATPESIQLFLDIVKNFTYEVQNLLNFSNSEKASNGISKYKNNLIIFDHTFENSTEAQIGVNKYNKDFIYENYFNAAIINGAGYQVVNNTQDTTNGLKTVSIGNYKKQTDLILEKYFGKVSNTFNLKTLYGNKIPYSAFDFGDTFENDDSKYSILPVSSVGTIGSKYDLLNLTNPFQNQETYEQIFLDILNYRTLKLTNFNQQTVQNQSQLTTGEQIVKGQLLDLFASGEYGSVYSITDLSTPKITKEQGYLNTDGTSTGSISSKIDKQQTSIPPLKYDYDPNSNPNSLLLTLLRNQLLSDSDSVNKLNNFTVFCPVDQQGEKNDKFFCYENDIIYLSSNSFTRFMRNLPIPIKNLMVARAQEFEVVNPFAYKNVKNNTDYVENFFSFWINFKKLYKVEYFEGFQTVDKQVLIKNPTWTELTINKLQTSKKNILCRLQKYKMEKFESYFPDVEKLEKIGRAHV